MKKYLALLLALCMVFCFSVTALATQPDYADNTATDAATLRGASAYTTTQADNTDDIANDHITGSGDDGIMQDAREKPTGSVPVVLKAEGLTFSVTVPTNLPIYVDKEGEVYTATANTITNNGYGPVVVTNVSVQDKGEGAASNYFELVSYDANDDLQDQPIGADKFSLIVDGTAVQDTGAVTLTTTNLAAANHTGASRTFQYDAYVSPQAVAVADAHIANVVFTVAWETVTAG